MIDVCFICGERKELFCCKNCESAFYCSRECQVANWKFHKKQCIKQNNRVEEQLLTKINPRNRKVNVLFLVRKYVGLHIDVFLDLCSSEIKTKGNVPDFALPCIEFFWNDIKVEPNVEPNSIVFGLARKEDPMLAGLKVELFKFILLIKIPNFRNLILPCTG